MAYPTSSIGARRILVLVVLLILVLRTSEARPFAVRRINSQSFLHELGYDKFKLDYYRRISKQDTGTARISPGGPDPGHNSAPTGLP